MSELRLNEMEQVSGGVDVIKPFTEADIRQAAIGFKNQGYYDKETLISVLDSLFPGMKSTVKKVVDLQASDAQYHAPCLPPHLLLQYGT